MGIKDNIIKHYKDVWQNTPVIRKWEKGPIGILPKKFCVLEFSPTERRKMWTYATCCMSEINSSFAIELHLFSDNQNDSLIELLTSVAHYHITGKYLNLNHIINFGRPWQDNSLCDQGIISLPYLDGPMLENLSIAGSSKIIKFYWLIPITMNEIKYVMENGINSLEEKFELPSFNYIDIHRKSVV